MSFTDPVFSVANILVLPFWASLVFFPRSRLTHVLFQTPTPMVLMAIFYSSVVVPAVIGDWSIVLSLAQPTLEGVRSLLATPVGAAAGWIHFLCFDLFVGAHIRQKALESNESFLWVSPILILVLMFGPLGWLLYTSIHVFVSRRASSLVEGE
jgi:hypothetical protein